MRIEGEWFRSEDGVSRPAIELDVHDRGGGLQRARFLIVSGSDRTVLNSPLLRRLGIPEDPLPAGFRVVGIGGAATAVVVRTTLEFFSSDGRPAVVRGEFVAFTDPRATDLSILGRDVLDNFDVILSRRRDEVLLLTGNHRYQVSPA